VATVVDDHSLTFVAPAGELWSSGDLLVRSRNGEAYLERAVSYMQPGLLAADTLQGSIFHIDPVTSVATTIQSGISIPTSGLAIDPSDGAVYAAHGPHGGQGPHVARIDLQFNSESIVANFQSKVNDMTVEGPGVLLVTSRNQQGIFRLTPSTGESVKLSSLPTFYGPGNSIAADNNGLVVVSSNGTAGNLVDFSDGAFGNQTLLLGAGDTRLRAMTFVGPALFAVQGKPSHVEASLVQINPSTGAIQQKGFLYGGMDALATIPLAP